MTKLKAVNAPYRTLGMTGGDALTLMGEAPIALAVLRDAHECWLPRFMAGAS